MKVVQTKSTTTTAAQPKTGQAFFQKQGEEGGGMSGDRTFFSGALQRTAGVSDASFFQKPAHPFIQAKLTIGQPGDPYEREADAMADQVVQRLAQPAAEQPTVNPSISTPALQPKCAACEQEEKEQQEQEETLPVQRKPIFDSGANEGMLQMKCAACEQEDTLLQPRAATPSTNAGAGLNHVESSLAASKGGGSPLPEDTRTDMEGAFGTDFSGVRVHTDGSAVQMNRDLQAQAFTHGSDVYFNSGKYDTGSTEGKRLLGHELTHVVQQGGGEVIRRAPSRGAGGCGPVNVVDEDDNGARAAGRTAHTQIQSYLLTQSRILAELPIPRATKTNKNDPNCQPINTEYGYADLFSLGMSNIGIAEIKPIAWANTYALEEANHYIRRGTQSMERYSHLGACALQGPGQDDTRFANNIGVSVNRPASFYKLGNILTTDTVIGRFDGDPTRTLKAKLVQPGAVGYWCTGQGTDTYTCGVSEEETNQYIDRVLLPAQDLLDDFLRRSIEEPIDQAIQSLSVDGLFSFGRMQLGGLFGAELQILNSLLPPGVTIEQIINVIIREIGPYARPILLTLLRRLKSRLVNELRLAIRSMLRQMIQETLVALCVGAPVVVLAQLLQELEKKIKEATKTLIPVLATAIAIELAREAMNAMLRALMQVLSEAMSAIGDFLVWLWPHILEVLIVVGKIIGTIILAVLVIACLIMAFLLIFDGPIIGDEAAMAALAAWFARLIPTLWQLRPN